MMKKSKKYYSIRSYLSYLGRYKPSAILVFTTFAISNALLAIIPIFLGKLVGTLTNLPVNKNEAYTYVFILIGCSILHDLTWRLSELLFLKLMNPMRYRYENIVFQQVIDNPYPYFVDKFTGKISSYVDTLAVEFRTFTDSMFWNYPNYIISIVTVSIILTTVNIYTGLIFVVGLLLMLVAGKYTLGNNTKYEKIWADVNSTKTGKIVDSIMNFVNVKSFQKEQKEIKDIKNEQEITIKASHKSFIWSIIFWFSMSIIIRYLIWPFIILLNVWLYLDGQITIADLTTVLTAILLFTGYIWEIVWAVSQFSLKLARIEEAHTYLFGNTNIVKGHFKNKLTLAKQPEFQKYLSLNNLTFSYPDNPQQTVLSNINITVKKNEKIGIVGKSGSGKTTLTKILLGYYDVSSKQISVDDQPITGTRELSKLVSYVPQDTSLFHRTIKVNISYCFDEEVAIDKVVSAAKKAHADEFITKIKGGYDALVGERGVKLSAGQRQRIAIARAFLDDKPILILDEATSALDSESEVLVQKALENLWSEKTVIAIAHRLSTLRHMDRIIVMDAGKIVEEGTHTELVKAKGVYAKLWAHQSGGFLED